MKRFNARKYIVFLIDLLITAFSYAVCMTLYNRSVQQGVLNRDFLIHLTTLIILAAAVRFFVYGYNRVWRYAVATDYIAFVFIDVFSFILFYLANRINEHYGVFERIGTIDIMHILAAYALSTVLILVSRFAYIFLRNHQPGPAVRSKKNAIIVGAGEAGVLLADELLRAESFYSPVAFIDKDDEKANKNIRGIRVYREGVNIASLTEKLRVETAIIAIPSLSLERRKQIVKAFTDAGCSVKIYDYQMSRSDKSEGRLAVREVRIEELLGREAVNLDTRKCIGEIRGRRILVTGAGGSIGGELCRQIAGMEPEALVMLDVYENSTYEIQQELIRRYGDSLNLSVEIASVCDTDALERVFDMYKPQLVFHAAAHKHVPLMEDCCREAVLNNVFGTYNVACAAERHGVERMLLISTDKAVNPTNVMGATKRLCEMIIMSKHKSKTEYVAVRFGNVLGSNGSVIPLFKRQIEEGGPVTVTDKRIVRYFMTIPEAVSLVLETEAMASDCEIFVLDMGEPVKILDLAESLITLSGYTPYKDIDITEVGLRPGEKLYEELLIKTDGLRKTDNSKIFIDNDTHLDEKDMKTILTTLRAAAETGDNATIRKAICDAVPTYTPLDNTESREKAKSRLAAVK